MTWTQGVAPRTAIHFGIIFPAPLSFGYEKGAGLLYIMHKISAARPRSRRAEFVIITKPSQFFQRFFVQHCDLHFPELFGILLSTGEAREAHPSRQQPQRWCGGRTRKRGSSQVSSRKNIRLDKKKCLTKSTRYAIIQIQGEGNDGKPHQ